MTFDQGMFFASLPCRTQAKRSCDSEFFRTIFHDADMGVAVMACDGRIVEMNQVLTRLLGDITHYRALFDGNPEEAALDRLLSGQCRQWRFDRRLEREDGTALWLRVSVFSIRDSEDQPCYLVALVDDVSIHHHSGEALRAAEAKYRSIFENASEGIFQTSGDGRYLSANPALAKIYGYESVDDLMEGLTNIARQLYVDPRRRDEFIRLLTNDDEVQGFVSEIYRKDRSVIWISERCRAVRNDAGQILYYEGMVEDITDRKHNEEKLRHDALHDGLTGLPNRALFIDRLHHAMGRHRRHGVGYAVLFIDCDHFKLINDSLGHLAGDQLLVSLARRVGQSLRTADTLARLGGDEFAVLVEDSGGTDDVLGVAERIQASMEGPFVLCGEEYYLTISIGIAKGSPAYGEPQELLRDADTAMYESKTAGRDRHTMFEPGMHLEAVTQLQVANDLRRALERNEFLTHFQPIIRLADGALAGFEALIRWAHPERGMVPPDQFIPAAEASGLIHAIDQWVLEVSCRQLAEWRARHPSARDLFMSVNLSPSQLQRPNIVDELRDVVETSGLDPSCIRLEITESGIMENLALVTGKLDALKAQGFSLALDDFGTGYSSLAHLHRFPIDTLKIDRSFVMHMTHGGEHREIVRTILLLGDALGKSVVAEGVETAEHRHMLTELGCTFGQGWLFAKALPAELAEGWVAGTHKAG